MSRLTKGLTDDAPAAVNLSTAFSALPRRIDSSSSATLTAPSIILGLLTASNAHRARHVHRSTWMLSPCVRVRASSFIKSSAGFILVRFVVWESDFITLKAEQSSYGDLAFVGPTTKLPKLKTVANAPLLPLKPLLWLQYAVLRHPTATLIGKMDSDTYVYPCLLLRDLESRLAGMESHKHMYYGTHQLFHGCNQRGPPPATCHAQGGLYVLSAAIANWTLASPFVARHPPVSYAFEDSQLGAWVAAFTRDTNESVLFAGDGVYGDREARLKALSSGKYSAGPWLHLNLHHGGEDWNWCSGVYQSMGCCRHLSFRTRTGCAKEESENCRREPLKPMHVSGCSMTAHTPPELIARNWTEWWLTHNKTHPEYRERPMATLLPSGMACATDGSSTSGIGQVITSFAECKAAARHVNASGIYPKVKKSAAFQYGCSKCNGGCSVWDRGYLFFNEKKGKLNRMHDSVCRAPWLGSFSGL
jgi:hypothetical protein